MGCGGSKSVLPLNRSVSPLEEHKRRMSSAIEAELRVREDKAAIDRALADLGAKPALKPLSENDQPLREAHQRIHEADPAESVERDTATTAPESPYPKWIQNTDPGTGYDYYINAETMTTTWERPECKPDEVEMADVYQRRMSHPDNCKRREKVKEILKQSANEGSADTPSAIEQENAQDDSGRPEEPETPAESVAVDGCVANSAQTPVMAATGAEAVPTSHPDTQVQAAQSPPSSNRVKSPAAAAIEENLDALYEDSNDEDPNPSEGGDSIMNEQGAGKAQAIVQERQSSGDNVADTQPGFEDRDENQVHESRTATAPDAATPNALPPSEKAKDHDSDAAVQKSGTGDEPATEEETNDEAETVPPSADVVTLPPTEVETPATEATAIQSDSMAPSRVTDAASPTTEAGSASSCTEAAPSAGQEPSAPAAPASEVASSISVAEPESESAQSTTVYADDFEPDDSVSRISDSATDPQASVALEVAPTEGNQALNSTSVVSDVPSAPSEATSRPVPPAEAPSAEVEASETLAAAVTEAEGLALETQSADLSPSAQRKAEKKRERKAERERQKREMAKKMEEDGNEVTPALAGIL